MAHARSSSRLALVVSVAAIGLFGAIDTAYAAGACTWADGQDAAGPADDHGRGVSDWTQHQGYVLAGTGLTDAHKLVRARLATLEGCLDKELYAKAYADLSVLIAAYGRTGAAWVDGSDAAAPSDDGGRGIGNWRAHYDYVITGKGTAASKLVGERLKTLSGKLSKETYARLYADVSIFIATFARSAPADMPPVAAAASATPCKWADGQDPAGPADDHGRGVGDWTQHQGYVLTGAGLDNAGKLVGARLAALKGCLSGEAYARAYADVSILVARSTDATARAGSTRKIRPALPTITGAASAIGARTTTTRSAPRGPTTRTSSSGVGSNR